MTIGMTSAQHELASLAASPELVDEVLPDRVPDLLAAVEGLRARLWARLMQPSSAPVATPATNGDPDRLLTAKEAADRLGVDRRWIYRKADALPFTRRLTPGTLRFSETGLLRWMASRR